MTTLELAEKYREDIVKFMSKLIKAQSYSGQEKEVIQVIKEEMEKVGFDEVKIDGLGNVLGRIGNGKHIIAMDAHIDTVEVGNPDLWIKTHLVVIGMKNGYMEEVHRIRKQVCVPWYMV
nr:hypothetical protein [Marinitoga lauensis]